MTDKVRAAQRTKKLPAAAILLTTIVLLVAVLWRLDRAPSTDDAYVYADTISVVPEVSGRIVELPVRDNQAVRRGDLLLRIDPRPYQAALDQARARLDTLERQIVLTQRSVNAQQFNADSARSSVERARAVANQAADTLRRTEPLLAQGYVSAEEVDRARTAQRAEVKAQIAIAELNLEFTEVRAPFDGRVVSLRTTVGQFASVLKPVFTLIDLLLSRRRDPGSTGPCERDAALRVGKRDCHYGFHGIESAISRDVIAKGNGGARTAIRSSIR